MKNITELHSPNPIQHWLITPRGSYYGYPTYGNNIEDLFFLNMQDATHKTGVIINKIKKDLGYQVARTIQEVVLLQDAKDLGKIFILIRLADSVAIGEYNV